VFASVSVPLVGVYVYVRCCVYLRVVAPCRVLRMRLLFYLRPRMCLLSVSIYAFVIVSAFLLCL